MGNHISDRALTPLLLLCPHSAMLSRQSPTKTTKMSHLQRTSRLYSDLPAVQPPVMQTNTDGNDRSPEIAPHERAPARENAPAGPPGRQSHLSVAAASGYFASVSSVSVPVPKHDSLFSGFTFTFGRSKRTSGQSSQPAEQNSRRRTFGSLHDSIVEAGKHLLPKKRKRENYDEGCNGDKSFVVLRRPHPHCRGCRCHPAHQAADAEAEREARAREVARQPRGRQELRVVRPVVPVRLPSPAPSLRWAGDEAEYFRRLVLAADGERFAVGMS